MALDIVPLYGPRRGLFLMSEVYLEYPVFDPQQVVAPHLWGATSSYVGLRKSVQGYHAHKKTPPPRILQ